jgi:NADPH2:quinone reductase
LPAVLHGDVAGVVEAVAPDVRGFRPGDEVYACGGGVKGMGGALAEFMLVDAALVALKPKSLSMIAAAALPLVTITAWQGIFERAPIGPGTKLLIHGGAGGVGHIAIQLAKQAGAQVFVTASSPRKMAVARSLGADEVIDYRRESVQNYVARLTDGNGFDVVFDTVSGGNLKHTFEATRLNGDVVATVALGEFDLSPVHLKALSLHVIFMLIPLIHNVGRSAYGEILREAAALVDEGKLRPVIDPHPFPMAKIADAHALLESGEALGKVVLSWE